MTEQELILIKEMVSYIDEMNDVLDMVAEELTGELEEDTKDLFNQLIDGINWAVQSYEDLATMHTELKEKEFYSQQEELMNEFSETIMSKDLPKVGTLLSESMKPYLIDMQEAITDYLNED